MYKNNLYYANLKDDLNESWLPGKPTSIENHLKGRWPQKKITQMEDNLKSRYPQETSLMEDDPNERKPQWKMTL